MRYFCLGLLLFLSLPVYAQNVPTQPVLEEKAILIRSIEMQGFVLGDKARFTKLFKPYRNKYLTSVDMDGLLKKIQDIYEREGYQELVSITYKVIKHRLVFNVLMIS